MMIVLSILTSIICSFYVGSQITNARKLWCKYNGIIRKNIKKIDDNEEFEKIKISIRNNRWRKFGEFIFINLPTIVYIGLLVLTIYVDLSIIYFMFFMFTSSIYIYGKYINSNDTDFVVEEVLDKVDDERLIGTKYVILGNKELIVSLLEEKIIVKYDDKYIVMKHTYPKYMENDLIILYCYFKETLRLIEDELKKTGKRSKKDNNYV